MFNFTLARSMPRATTWSMVCLVLWGQVKLGLAPQYQVCFSVSGVNLNHAVQVGDGLLVPTFVHQLRSAVEALLGVAEP